VVELPPPLVPFPLGTDEVGGGVEIDALAPACAATCSAQVKDRKNEIRSRQAIEAGIISATTRKEGPKERENVSEMDENW
jgi:hypothetical protein